MNKKFYVGLAVIAAALVLGGCAKFAKEENFSETESSPAIGAEANYSNSGSETEETEADYNNYALEALIAEASDKPDSYSIRTFASGDFDNDGRDEFVAVYGSDEDNIPDLTSSTSTSYGELWFADDEGAVLLYTENEWALWNLTFDLGDTVILHAETYPDKLSFCFKMTEGRPKRMDTFQLRDITYTGDRNFTGYSLAFDGGNDKTTIKPYWFYLPEESEILFEYRGTEITMEEFSEYEGSQQVLDLIALEYGSEITNILYRDNGIININYKAEALGSQFKTLRVLEDGSVEDITPYENKGWYLSSASGGYFLDYVIY